MPDPFQENGAGEARGHHVSSRDFSVQTKGSPAPRSVDGRSRGQRAEHGNRWRQRVDGRRRAFVSERWTLVEMYERDGKQYIVATCNDAWLAKHKALSPRESQALGFAVLGDSNKLVAYKLGVSASTVGVLLHRAAEKLGCHSRRELLARFLELAAAPRAPEPCPGSNGT
jgi:DNA-binding CsgD family transcriptional regulator